MRRMDAKLNVFSAQGLLALACWGMLGCAGGPPSVGDGATYGRENGRVWVSGPWEAIKPSTDVDEVIGNCMSAEERVGSSSDSSCLSIKTPASSPLSMTEPHRHAHRHRRLSRERGSMKHPLLPLVLLSSCLSACALFQRPPRPIHAPPRRLLLSHGRWRFQSRAARFSPEPCSRPCNSPWKTSSHGISNLTRARRRVSDVFTSETHTI